MLNEDADFRPRLIDVLKERKALWVTLRELRFKAEKDGDIESIAYFNMHMAWLQLSEPSSKAKRFEDWARDVVKCPKLRTRNSMQVAMREQLYDKIRGLHERSGLSVRRVAELASVSPNTVQALLSRRGMPQEAKFEAIVAAYDSAGRGSVAPEPAIRGNPRGSILSTRRREVHAGRSPV